MSIPSPDAQAAASQDPERLLTIGEIAARARRLATDPYAFIDRCRHWAKSGLLQAAERVGEGAGRHALFRESEAYMAAVIAAFAEAGLPPAGSRAVADALGSYTRDHLARWLRDRERGRPPQSLMLEIIFYPGGGKTMEAVRNGVREKTTAKQAALRKARGFDPTKRPMTTITVDLGALWESVAATGGRA
jgi:hypothetical protein